MRAGESARARAGARERKGAIKCGETSERASERERERGREGEREREREREQ
jgi:hypothetical protein